MSTAPPVKKKMFVKRRQILPLDPEPEPIPTSSKTCATQTSSAALPTPSSSKDDERHQVERDFFSKGSGALSMMKVRLEKDKKTAQKKKQVELEQERKVKAKDKGHGPGRGGLRKRRSGSISEEEGGEQTELLARRRKKRRSSSLTPPPQLYPDLESSSGSENDVQVTSALHISKAPPYTQMLASASASASTSMSTPDMHDHPEVDLDPELAARAREAKEAKLLAASQADSTPSVPEPIVEILIHSDIPNTQQLLIRRRLAAPLKAVRIAWGTRQGLSNSEMARLVLVWQRKIKMFDSSTCRTCNIDVDEEGRPYIATGRQRRYLEDGKIYFDAMYREDWEELKKANEMRASLVGQDIVALDEDEGEGEDEDEDEEKSVARINVKVKGKGIELMFKVDPTAPLQELLEMIRESRNVGEDRRVRLKFDGDDLEEGTSLEDAGIENGDMLDVKID